MDPVTTKIMTTTSPSHYHDHHHHHYGRKRPRSKHQLVRSEAICPKWNNKQMISLGFIFWISMFRTTSSTASLLVAAATTASASTSTATATATASTAKTVAGGSSASTTFSGNTAGAGDGSTGAKKANAQTQTQTQTHDTCITSTQCLNGGRCMQPDGTDKNQKYKYCICKDGFSGQRCEHYCPLKCHNHGVCFMKDRSNPSDYEYGNSHYPTTSSSSSSTQSQHHVENDHSNNFSCKCRGHFMGKLCETPYDNCGTDGQHRCFNGGVCVTNDQNIRNGTATSTSSAASTSTSTTTSTSVFTCHCPSGWGGEQCETRQPNETVDLKAIQTKGGKAGFGIGLMLLALALTFVWITFVWKKHGRPPSNRRYKLVRNNNHSNSQETDDEEGDGVIITRQEQQQSPTPNERQSTESEIELEEKNDAVRPKKEAAKFAINIV